MNLIKHIFAYFTSLILVTVFVIYLLDLPTFLTGANELIKEYYYDHLVESFILDIFLFAGYIAVGLFFINLFNIKENYQKLITVAISSFLLTTFFILLFKYNNQNSFFSRWFKRVGMLASLYDMLIVSSVFILYKVTLERIK
jgi:hypothetical protein